MTEKTRSIIKDALIHRERNYRGFAAGDRIDALACRRAADPVIRSRSENLEERANDGEAKADEVRIALAEFDDEIAASKPS